LRKTVEELEQEIEAVQTEILRLRIAAAAGFAIEIDLLLWLGDGMQG
jgi:hypothetical protein